MRPLSADDVVLHSGEVEGEGYVNLHDLERIMAKIPSEYRLPESVRLPAIGKFLLDPAVQAAWARDLCTDPETGEMIPLYRPTLEIDQPESRGKA